MMLQELEMLKRNTQVTSENLKNDDRYYYEKKATTKCAVCVLMVYNIRMGTTHMPSL